MDTITEAIDASANLDDTIRITNDQTNGEYCCAGVLCGVSNGEVSFMLTAVIKHRCVICKGAMHGGICGAEASTVLENCNLGTMDVICFPCITKENTKKVKKIIYMNNKPIELSNNIEYM